MKVEEVQLKLISEIQVLPPETALEHVNKALRDIYREHDWSFLYERGLIETPRLINGVGEVEQYNNEIAASTDLRAILDAIDEVNSVPIVGRQLRSLGGQVAGSEFDYTITDYDSGTGIITIDRPYLDANSSAARLQIYKRYYTAPNLIVRDSGGNIIFEGIDLAHFEYIYGPFARKKLGLYENWNSLESRRRTQISFGDPYYAVGYDKDSAGNRLFEFYPIPNNNRIYQVLYKRKGRDLVLEDDIPGTLDYDLVLTKAKIKAYEWMIVNGEKVGDKRSANVWLNLIAMKSNPNAEDSYPKLLAAAKLEDENLYPQALIDMGHMYPYYDEVIVETVLLDF